MDKNLEFVYDLYLFLGVPCCEVVCGVWRAVCGVSRVVYTADWSALLKLHEKNITYFKVRLYQGHLLEGYTRTKLS